MSSNSFPSDSSNPSPSDSRDPHTDAQSLERIKQILLGDRIDQIMQQSPKHLILTGGDAHLFAKFLSHYQPQVESDLFLNLAD